MLAGSNKNSKTVSMQQKYKHFLMSGKWKKPKCLIMKREPSRKCPHCTQPAVTHRFDVTVQEADRVDALYGLQDLAPQTQGGADAEGSPGHTPPQVGQVTTL